MGKTLIAWCRLYYGGSPQIYYLGRGEDGVSYIGNNERKSQKEILLHAAGYMWTQDYLRVNVLSLGTS